MAGHFGFLVHVAKRHISYGNDGWLFNGRRSIVETKLHFIYSMKRVSTHAASADVMVPFLLAPWNRLPGQGGCHESELVASISRLPRCSALQPSHLDSRSQAQTAMTVAQSRREGWRGLSDDRDSTSHAPANNTPLHHRVPAPLQHASPQSAARGVETLLPLHCTYTSWRL